VKILASFSLIVAAALAAFAQADRPRLPRGAEIIETRVIPGRSHQDRALVLWMLNPKRNPLEYGPEEYTCPDATRGSYYSGPTRVSLIDTTTRRVINTVTVDSGEGGFDVPYKIKQGLYYEVAGVAKDAEGKPTIMALKDYNGDGVANEFALFDAPACMGLQTILIGYSERSDRVISYPIALTVIEGRRRTVQTNYWIDYLFSRQPDGPRHWKYEIDYRGRGGTLDKYEIRYNVARERFEGTLRITR
jgi:hypothetical protein